MKSVRTSKAGVTLTFEAKEDEVSLGRVLQILSLRLKGGWRQLAVRTMPNEETAHFSGHAEFEERSAQPESFTLAINIGREARCSAEEFEQLVDLFQQEIAAILER